MHESHEKKSLKPAPKLIIIELARKITGKSEIAWVVVVLLFFVIIRFGLGFNGLYGQDAHEYLRFGKALHQFFLTGANPGDYIWPVNFPLYGALLSLLLSSVNFSMQILSVFSFIGILLYKLKILKLIFPGDEEKMSLVLCCFL